MKIDGLFNSMQNNQQLANEASQSSERECSDDISSNYNKLSDEEIVRRYNGNKDESAFSNIDARYRGKIYSIAVGITHDTHKADDIVQDVFLILVKKLHLFRREAKFSTWLHRIVVNATLAQLRKEIPAGIEHRKW